MEAQSVNIDYSKQPNAILVGRMSPAAPSAQPTPSNIVAFAPAPEPEKIVPKRTAKSVAEELTGRPVKAKEQHGRYWLFVEYLSGTREFSGATWWFALCALNAHLAKEKAKKP